MISLRPLRRDDFALLRRWLAEPLVHRWWFHESAPAALERDFGPSIDGVDPGEVFVVLDPAPFGLIQRYPIGSSPEYLAELVAVCDVPARAVSIDYLIGEPDRRGRGVGASMIAVFVARTWAEYPGTADVVVPVAAANRASWRSLEVAGFTRIGEGELTPDNPGDPRDHVVYRISRSI